MKTMKVLTRRRKRRQGAAALKRGKKAKPTHKAKTGRTGQIFSKKNHSKKQSNYHKVYVFIFPAFVEMKELGGGDET